MNDAPAPTLTFVCQCGHQAQDHIRMVDEDGGVAVESGCTRCWCNDGPISQEPTRSYSGAMKHQPARKESETHGSRHDADPKAPQRGDGPSKYEERLDAEHNAPKGDGGDRKSGGTPQAGEKWQFHGRTYEITNSRPAYRVEAVLIGDDGSRDERRKATFGLEDVDNGSWTRSDGQQAQSPATPQGEPEDKKSAGEHAASAQ